MTRLTRLPHPLAVAALAAWALTGAACGDAGPASRATTAQRSACRQRADDVYLEQHRDAVYRADSFATSTRDAPFSSSGLPGDASTGLSGRYARDRILSNCIDGLSGAPAQTPGAASPAGRGPAGAPLATTPTR